MEFANKEYLFLLLLVIPYLIWYVMYRKKTEPTIRMSDTFAFRFAPKSWKVRLMPLSMLLRVLAFVMIILVLARPQTHNSWASKTVEGIDIMLAMDVASRLPSRWLQSSSSVVLMTISVLVSLPARRLHNVR